MISSIIAILSSASILNFPLTEIVLKCFEMF
nr:MAG TPA: hypothetical protein [Caudoviricetes sp.]